jgi:hypothetical protein
MHSQKKPWIFKLVSVFIGIYLLYILSIIISFNNVDQWLPIDAQITKCNSFGTGGGVYYRIEYSFEIDDNILKSNNIYITGYDLKREVYNNFLEIYEKNESLPIFVDVNDHSKSVVYNTLQAPEKAWIFLMLVMFLTAIGSHLYMSKD